MAIACPEEALSLLKPVRVGKQNVIIFNMHKQSNLGNFREKKGKFRKIWIFN